MKLNFLSKNLPAFGLEISGDSFKIVQLEHKGTDMAFKARHDGVLPKGLVVNDAISDVKTFQYLVKQALQKPQYGQINTNYVVASLPESKSFVRVIQIPQMTEAEAENAVPFEAESFIPLPLDQVYLDWQKIGQTGDSSRLGGQAEAGKMNVLMVASPKDFVDKYLEVLDQAGLKPVALEVESQSCHRALIAPGSSETVMLADLGALRSSLIMVEDGNLQFTSTLPIAGNTFTESIARALGVSSIKAEEIKKKVGISNTAEYPNITTALLPVLNNLAEEIKNILKFHGEHSNRQVSKVLLLGGSSCLKNLVQFLGPQLQTVAVASSELAVPWQSFSPAMVGEEALVNLGFITAIGLAMRGLDNKLS